MCEWGDGYAFYDHSKGKKHVIRFFLVKQCKNQTKINSICRLNDQNKTDAMRKKACERGSIEEAGSCDICSGRLLDNEDYYASSLSLLNVNLC